MKSHLAAARSWAALSAPTRGPWIEILAMRILQKLRKVGPHTGAVD